MNGLNESSSFDAVVIGAGYGGLIAAAVLSREGLRVLVTDPGPEIGGTCSSVWAGDMYTPYGYATSRDTSDQFFFMSRKHRFGAIAAARAGATLALAGPFKPVMRVHVLETGDVVFLGGPFEPYAKRILGIPEQLIPEFRAAWDDLLSLDPATWMEAPLSSWLAKLSSEPLRKGFVNFANVFAAPSPEETSLGRFAKSLSTPIEIYYPDDETAPGMSGVTEPFARVVRECGGTIALGQNPVEFNFDGRQIKALSLQDTVSRVRTVSAPIVIFAQLPDGLCRLIDEDWLGPDFVRDTANLREHDCDIAVQVTMLRHMPLRRADSEIEDYPSWNRILRGPTRSYGGGWWFPSLTSRQLSPGGATLEVGYMSPDSRPYANVESARSVIRGVWEYLREFYIGLDELVENQGLFIHHAPNNDEWRLALAPRLPIIVPGVEGVFHVSAAADVDGVIHDIDANAALLVADHVLARRRR
jgi:hypothetical protein